MGKGSPRLPADSEDSAAAADSGAAIVRQQSGCLPFGRSSQARIRRGSSKDAKAETEMSLVTDGSLEMCSPGAKLDHLVVMVNGIVGSASNWEFAAKKFREAMGETVLIHCSTCNSSTLTFEGVDVMGKRLAEEIQEVVERVQGMERISFVSHSLGGLVSRYAIAKLYSPADQGLKNLEREEQPGSVARGTVAGLEPTNFITVATPHFGSRGHRQLPFLCGFRCLEKVAVQIGHWFIGRTGRHLFLTDGRPDHPPLLVRMVTDCEEGMFLSALLSFRRHVAYANIDCDKVVGWGTSSLRRLSELPKNKHGPVDPKYPHIISVDAHHAQNGVRKLMSPVSGAETAPASDPLEETMVSTLQKIGWERVDVSFGGSPQSFVAHSIIQVKSHPDHAEGEDVIQHMIDHFLL